MKQPELKKLKTAMGKVYDLWQQSTDDYNKDVYQKAFEMLCDLYQKHGGE